MMYSPQWMRDIEWIFGYYAYIVQGLYEPNGNIFNIVKLRQGSGKDRQGMAVKAKGLKA